MELTVVLGTRIIRPFLWNAAIPEEVRSPSLFYDGNRDGDWVRVLVSITVRNESGYASTLNNAVGGFVSTVTEACSLQPSGRYPAFRYEGSWNCRWLYGLESRDISTVNTIGIHSH